MATFNIGSTLLVAGAERHSAAITPGENFNRAEIFLVDTDSQWPATPDMTRFVRIWGLQQSFDGGANWQWGPIWVGNPSGDPNDRFGPEGVDYWLPFGFRRRDGGMPGMAVESSQIVGIGTTRLRLAIVVDANIRLGATVQTL